MTNIIPYGKHYLDETDIEAVVACLRSGALTQGEFVQNFERTVADLVGVEYAVAVATGTCALHLAVLAAGLKPGDAMITSPLTFVASSNAALFAGGTPVFADISGRDLCISPDSLSAAVASNSRVRGVMPVHFAGLSCNMKAIHEIATESNLFVIEDAAHALGARYDSGEMIGSCRYSDMTVFSFHPVKSIATGEGGMITTKDERLYRKLLRLRSHGINKGDDPFQLTEEAQTDGRVNPWYYEMQDLGYNYRITDIQCALGISQMKKLPMFINRRKALAARYDQALSRWDLVRPAQTDGRDRSAHHLYPVRIDYKRAGVSRQKLMTELKALGYLTQVHYIPVPAQPYYRRLGFDPAAFPETQAYYERALSLPLYYSLRDEEQDQFLDALQGLLK